LPAVRYLDVHYVYVLRSLKDGNLYTGYTSDLRKRVARAPILAAKIREPGMAKENPPLFEA
jgi:hypothetical protein